HAHSLQAFKEMQSAGITAVGEFHYIHHTDQGLDFALDEAVLAAAREARIRIVLLHACYLAGGFGQPLSGAQGRFDGADLDTWWAAVDRAADACHGSMQSIGVVIHSLRAVPIDVAAEIRAEAKRRNLVLHLHLEEQPAEIEACRAAHGCTPMRLVLDRLEPGPDMTAVHCTHTDSMEMSEYASTGAHVCLCPLTEANLGDGLADVTGMRTDDASICLGTDSNARISMLEEMRWCEYGQRLKNGHRGVCADEDGRIDRPLLDMATCAGAQALGIEAGDISVGSLADFTRIDLGSDSLASVPNGSLATALITGGDVRSVAGIVIDGRE
ncbi:MAG: amidohydrolase family protein, partial [Phycisphaerales bacterium]|nr:amidohydrolase family protein [Phycisphaerales bacterium]